MTGASPHVTKIGGDLSLRNAGQLAATLKQDLAKHADIVVVFDAVSGIDLTTLQILAAARKSAMASGKTLSLQLPAGGIVHDLLRRAGFVDPSGIASAPEGDFWTPPQPKGKAA